MYSSLVCQGRRVSLLARNIRHVRSIVPARTLAKSYFNEPARTLENSINNRDTFLVFPEIIGENSNENEFTSVPSNGQIPCHSLTVEKIVKATGKFSVEFEHFIDDYSRTLKTEFADQDVSNSKLNEFITEMEKHLMPLNYNLNLLNNFRIIRPNEFNFVTFNHFFNARYRKARQRFIDRQIYCFMCEMKARREFFDNDSKANNPNGKLAFEQKQKNQIVDRYIRESKLLGQSLKHQDQNLYKLINEKLQEFQVQYMSNVMQATERFKANIISPQFLDCLPDHVITNLNHHDADSVFQSFMRYCPDQNLRKDFWYSFYGRAAKVMGSKITNAPVIESIRDFRTKKAKLLGYESFADMAVHLRGAGGATMAGSVDNVNAFISGLGSRSDQRFNEAIKELEDFATGKSVQKGSKSAPKNTVETLNLWDVKYFERLFLRKKYEIETSEVKKHFPVSKVVSGMLSFAENLFGLKIVEQKVGDGVETWGPNCRLFKVFSNNSKSMAELGSFYFDLFQRESKIMMPLPRCDSMGTKPLAFFLMNFNTGWSIFDQFDKNQQIKSPDKEVMLDFEQVVDMFGKFGFVLQHLLTEVKYSEINSLHNIEVDAFHLVSHFMRCWPLNSYEVISSCSQHVETGQPISEEFFQRMNKAYYHFTSIVLMHNLYMMAMDLNLHATKEPLHVLQKNIWNQFMSPFEQNQDDGHMCAALDIFTGNSFESVTYGNKWSEVIAADIFDAFRADSESGMRSHDQIRQLGERFRETFLAQTGAVSTNELFRRFRGRDAVLDGFLSINQLD